MGATFSRLKNWVAEILSYADLNAEIDNILTNLTPAGMDDMSANVAAMQATTDPGEVGSESLATSLSDEIKRLRFAIQDIKGTGSAQWYSTPTASLTDFLNAIGGALVQNRIISGAMSSNSGASRFLIPGGSSATVVLDASPTSFVYAINSTQYTISADGTVSGLSTAAASNNTALVNDTTLTAQESSKWIGEDGTTLIMDTVGTGISALIGSYGAFKIVNGGNTEYFVGFVASATTITNCLRGCFIDSTSAAVNRIAINDNNTITLMKLTWLFADTGGTVTAYSGATNPSISFTQPSDTLTHWYDIANHTWKTYNGSAWVASNKLLIGICAQDSTNCKVARSFSFYGNYDHYSNVIVDYSTATTVTARNIGSKIGVGTSLIDYKTTKPVWDITLHLESGFSEAASTTYFLYIGESGQLKMSPNKPYLSADLMRGWYHPYENWRAVGYVFNDASQNFDPNIPPYMYPVDQNSQQMFTAPEDLRNIGITATVPAAGLLITVNAADGTALSPGNPGYISFRSATRTSGAIVTRTLTSNLTITVPNGATLGHTALMDQYVWIYLVAGASFVDVAVSGVTVHDERTPITASAIDTNSDSGTGLYAVNAHTLKSIRRFGRILIQEAVAGAWATAPTEVAVMTATPQATITEPIIYTPTYSAGFGTTTGTSMYSYRVGKYLHIKGFFNVGTVAASGAQMSIGYAGTNTPSGMSVDLTQLGSGNTIIGLYASNTNQVAGGILYSGHMVFQVNATLIGFSQPFGNNATSPIQTSNGNVVTATGAIMTLHFEVPIAGWSTYGPP